MKIKKSNKIPRTFLLYKHPSYLFWSKAKTRQKLNQCTMPTKTESKIERKKEKEKRFR